MSDESRAGKYEPWGSDTSSLIVGFARPRPKPKPGPDLTRLQELGRASVEAHVWPERLPLWFLPVRMVPTA